MGFFGKILGGGGPVAVEGRITILSRPGEGHWSLNTVFLPSTPGAAPPATLPALDTLPAATAGGGQLPIQDPGHIFSAQLTPGHWQVAVIATPFVGRARNPTGAGLRPDPAQRRVCFPLSTAFEVRPGEARTLSLKLRIPGDAPAAPDDLPPRDRLDRFDRERLEDAERTAASDAVDALALLDALMASPRSPPPVLPHLKFFADTARARALLTLDRDAEALAVIEPWGFPEADASDLIGPRTFCATAAIAYARARRWDESLRHGLAAIRVLSPYFRDPANSVKAQGLAVQSFSVLLDVMTSAQGWEPMTRLAAEGAKLGAEHNLFGIAWLSRGATVEAWLGQGRESEARAAAEEFLRTYADRGWTREKLIDLLPPLIRAGLSRAADLFGAMFDGRPPGT